MHAFKLSDEEYKRCFYKICEALPDVKHTTGSLWIRNTSFTSIDIIAADDLGETVHVRATFFPESYIYRTKNPIWANNEAIAHQLLSFGITDISEFDWH